MSINCQKLQFSVIENFLRVREYFQNLGKRAVSDFVVSKNITYKGVEKICRRIGEITRRK